MKTIHSLEDARRAGRHQAAQLFATTVALKKTPQYAHGVKSWFHRGAERMTLPLERVASAEAEAEWRRLVRAHRRALLRRRIKLTALLLLALALLFAAGAIGGEWGPKLWRWLARREAVPALGEGSTPSARSPGTVRA